MEEQYFKTLIKEFEASRGPTPIKSAEYREELKRWRIAVFTRVQRFEAVVVEQALASFEREKNLPSAIAIYDACAEIAHTSIKPLVAKFHPPEDHHPCRPCTDTPARRDLAAIFPYEAKHIACDANEATCPICGAHFVMPNELIQMLQSERPAETAGWNCFHKGLMLCQDCAAKETRR